MAARVAALPPIDARVAIAHDWFQGMHGSERVVHSMLDLFTQRPDVFTFSAARELLPPRLQEAIVRESRLARLPGIRQRGHEPGRWRALLPYMPTYWDRLELRGYDVVISSSHACAISAHPRDDALHVCYCYTPMRYVWLPDTDVRHAAGPKSAALSALRSRLRRQDLRAAARPDAYVAISTAVAERIGECYGREATVIFPPVVMRDLDPGAEKEPDHFLWVHRLVPYKRPLEVAEAFRSLPDLRLTMVGIGPLEDELRARLPPNVELRGWLERDELARLYERAAGFIHVGEEDFGITMVEALSGGTPVLAVAAGGARDIVEPDESGILIDDGKDPEQIAEGIRRLRARSWSPERLRESAERFSEDRFAERMAALLQAHGVG